MSALDACVCRPAVTCRKSLLRDDAILSHPVFNTHHTEHEMLRYLKRLQNRDLALDHSMISAGPCTMKLNATSEMIPVTWPEFADIHPFALADQTAGYPEMIGGLPPSSARSPDLTRFACSQTPAPRANTPGWWPFSAITPRGRSPPQGLPDPRSAHGTNPATAQMCGMDVVAAELRRQRKRRSHRPRRQRRPSTPTTRRR